MADCDGGWGVLLAYEVGGGSVFLSVVVVVPAVGVLLGVGS